MEKKINIETEIYPEKIIIEAINDYKDISDIEYSNNVLTIKWNKMDDIDEIFNEFMNYVIWLNNETV